MNILPLIAMILLILAMGSFALLQETVSTFWEKKTYLAFMKVERKARSEWELRQFKKTKTKNQEQKKEQRSSPIKKDMPFLSPREKKTFTDLAKFNITPLFSLTPGSPSYSFLYESAAELLRLLYSKTSVFQESDLPRIEYEILDTLIAKGKKKEKISSFAELFPEEPKLQEIFYKVAKGTSSDKSIPPLSDYFILDKDEKERAIHFNYAPKILLTAFFGAQTADTIIQEEKKKWEQKHKHIPLTKTELATLLQKKAPGSFSIEEQDKLFSFSKKSPKEKAFIVIDKDTGIAIRKKV